MHPRIYQSLRVFTHVGSELNLTAASKQLNMTKGAVSYQVKQLENSLGFDVFERTSRGLQFTDKGRELFTSAARHFEQLDRQIAELRNQHRQLTVGMTTYFASRWLAPRLMRFTSIHPEVRLRIQPTQGVVDLAREQLDLAIQWGDESSVGNPAELLFRCPAYATCGTAIHEAAQTRPLEAIVSTFPLLHDFEGSRSWSHWCKEAGIQEPPPQDQLVIEDPNVRVEAVISNQGIALNDELVRPELDAERMFRLSRHALSEYGYFLVFRSGAEQSADAEAFHQWIVREAQLESSQAQLKI